MLLAGRRVVVLRVAVVVTPLAAVGEDVGVVVVPTGVADL